MKQQTLQSELVIEGIGLHNGLKSIIKIKTAPQNSGIIFEHEGTQIQALYSNVSNTQNCTLIEKEGVTVSTIEHLMASLYFKGIDNAFIECSNPELPILDGSAKVFLEHLKNIQLKQQEAPRKYLEVLKPVKFEDESGNFIELSPPTTKGLHIYFEIEFPSKIVGKQIFDNLVTNQVFEREIAPCRTFCEKYQIDYLKSIGLIKGGSLQNAVVLDGESILNEEGFRLKNECVNHKVLDLIGDLYTSSYHILADVKAYRTGHYHNNMILKKLFETTDNYTIL